MMSIEEINKLCDNTMISFVGIEFLDINEEYIKARMPVNEKTKQPMGLLHGGAVMTLVETVASVGSFVLVDPSKYDVVGSEINGNHVGNTKSAFVFAVAQLLHRGTKTHVWKIDVFDENNTTISFCRMTVFIINKNEQ